MAMIARLLTVNLTKDPRRIRLRYFSWEQNLPENRTNSACRVGVPKSWGAAVR
jgi:hypothetical protein